MIYFPVPAPAQRQRLWQQSFPQEAMLDADVNLEEVAKKYELAGGSIINVVQYSCLTALKRNSRTILLKDVQAGIRKEFNKEGKTLNL
jgi:ATP-dependent 26S proteasome regulatory subunit